MLLTLLDRSCHGYLLAMLSNEAFKFTVNGKSAPGSSLRRDNFTA